MKVCPSCGLIAPPRWTECAACGAPWGGRLTNVTRDPDDPWCVAVRCQLQCRACQRLTPLDHLDVDGTVECRHCGHEQAFPPGSWREVVGMAGALGDLAGPDPEGRFPDPRVSIAAINPHRQTGVDRQAHSATVSGLVSSGGLSVARALQIEASPGHPVCASCHGPLRVSATAARVSTTCPTCGDATPYRTPPHVRELHEVLVGAIAPAHRDDVPEVKVAHSATGGPVALSCPGCGAPLTVASGGPLATCGFCHLTSRLPDRLGPRGATEARWWWLVFRGETIARRRLLRDPSVQGEPDGDAEVEDAPIAPATGRTRALKWAAILLFGGGALVVSGLVLAAVLVSTGEWPPW